MTGKKIKEPITLRYRLLKNGCKSLYLDYYNSGQRKYEFLKMYLVPETDKETKLLNKSVLKAANAIKLKRNQQVLFERSGLKQEPCNISLLEWLKECMANAMQQAKSKGRKEYSCYRNYNSTQKVVAKFLKSAYKHNDITLEEVNKEFCLKFIHYLDTCTNKWGQPFAQGSKNKYLSKFSSALQRAVRKGYIASNPTSLLDPDERIATAKTQREYLSEEELSRLVKTECPNAKVKQAFLFSCLCGLRWSDITTLEWSHVFLNEKTHRIEKRMVKTQELIYLPLSKDAEALLPKKNDKSNLVFSLPTLANVNRSLKKWAAAAKVNKHVTFHTARHTFATLLLSNDVDIYTVSKLLGHQNILTTQIYAQIIDKRKEDAINQISGIIKS